MLNELLGLVCLRVLVFVFQGSCFSYYFYVRILILSLVLGRVG